MTGSLDLVSLPWPMACFSCLVTLSAICSKPGSLQSRLSRSNARRGCLVTSPRNCLTSRTSLPSETIDAIILLRLCETLADLCSETVVPTPDLRNTSGRSAVFRPNMSSCWSLARKRDRLSSNGLPNELPAAEIPTRCCSPRDESITSARCVKEDRSTLVLVYMCLLEAIVSPCMILRKRVAQLFTV